MKKYIGTKQVEAEPMIKGDAWSQKLIREKPVLDEDLEEGYKVRCEDGYCFWSPKDVFEKAYKVADTFKDRLVIEQQELLIKYNKLVLFLAQKDAEEIVGGEQIGLMEEQKDAMHSYLNVLSRRIHPKSINPEDKAR